MIIKVPSESNKFSSSKAAASPPLEVFISDTPPFMAMDEEVALVDL